MYLKGYPEANNAPHQLFSKDLDQSDRTAGTRLCGLRVFLYSTAGSQTGPCSQDTGNPWARFWQSHLGGCDQQTREVLLTPYSAQATPPRMTQVKGPAVLRLGQGMAARG